MQKTIMKDPLFLSQKSTAADPKIEAQVVLDLQDTLRANRDRCVGMAGCAPCDGGVVIFFVSYSKEKKKREKG